MGLTEPLPYGARLTAAGPGVSVEPQEFNALQVPQRLTGQLSHGVVEQEQHGQTAQVPEGAAVHLADTVVMEKQPVQVD